MKKLTEIEVIEIQLHQKGISKNILEIIDRGIPYHIIFVLTIEGKAQVGIGYKEKIKKKDDKYRVERYYFSEWAATDELTFDLKGLNLDRIYENLLRQFLPDGDTPAQGPEGYHCPPERDRETDRSLRSIEKKMKSEKQFNVQIVLNRELREARIKLENSDVGEKFLKIMV